MLPTHDWATKPHATAKTATCGALTMTCALPSPPATIQPTYHASAPQLTCQGSAYSASLRAAARSSSSRAAHGSRRRRAAHALSGRLQAAHVGRLGEHHVAARRCVVGVGAAQGGRLDRAALREVVLTARQERTQELFVYFG